ncbi:spermidine/putrescine ABC transporter ATP-binding protein [Bacillus mycoides]|nr:spermidine/putrescine ABC transporter ATP-binding protein [Bacillus mycoides]QWG58962.1 spermidine/putrescine ABC transporter ATP-binding protein [Bacillus mycoides]QWH37227.1 spermidine/putrescine ABC transporter ATP-binding protein [Bacillus mycoides]
MYKSKVKLIVFIPLFAGSKIPPQNSGGAQKLGGRLTARKSPIGEG